MNVRPKKKALIIGISQYTSLKSLDSVVNDVEAMATMLETNGNFIVERWPYKYIDEEERYEIKSKEVSCNDLTKKIEEFLFETAKNSDALLYFSGHGLRVSNPASHRIPPKGYLCSSESRADGTNALLLSDLNLLFAKAREEKGGLSSLIVILDCCHAGMAIEYENSIEYSILNNEFTSFQKEEKYALLAACRSHQKAYFDRGGQSVLTKTILEGLKDNHANSDGVITFGSLAEFTKGKLNHQGQQAIDLCKNAVDLEIVRYPKKLGTQPIQFLDVLDKLNFIDEDYAFDKCMSNTKKVGAFWLNGEGGSGQRWLINRFWRGKHNYLFNNTVAQNIKISIHFNRKHSQKIVLEKILEELVGKDKTPKVEENLNEEIDIILNIIIDEIYKHCLNQTPVIIALFGIEKLQSDVIQYIVESFWKSLAEKILDKPNVAPLIFFLASEDLTNSYNFSFLAITNNNMRQQFLTKLELNKFKDNNLDDWIKANNSSICQMWSNFTMQDFRNDVIKYNQRDDVCNEDVLERICKKCGIDWYNDVVSKFNL